MKLTIIIGEVVSCIEVAPDIELENFLALCSTEVPALAKVPFTQLRLACNGSTISPSTANLQNTLNSFGINDGDAIYIEIQLPATGVPIQNQPLSSSASSSQQPNIAALISSLVSKIKVPSSAAETDKAERLRTKGLFDSMAEPGRLDFIRARYPMLATAYEANPTNYEAFHKAYLEFKKENLRRMRLMNDPTSEEGQRYIAEMINHENIDFSHQFAIEHMPEAFIPVHMLYIRMKINGHSVLAFVDSGAQVSILSESCAKRCGIDRLLDARFRATAIGVGGTNKFLGRIHCCQVQVEDHIFPCPFDVQSDRNIDILFGLNALRRHHCSIDLQKNVLRFGDGTETPFLNEEEYNREKTIIQGDDPPKATQDEEMK